MKKVHAIFSLLLVSGWSHAYSTVFNPFTGKLDYVGISTSSLAAQAILNQATLQLGATFYVSSGTVSGQLIVASSTGRMGVGIATPAAMLDVFASTGVAGIKFSGAQAAPVSSGNGAAAASAMNITGATGQAAGGSNQVRGGAGGALTLTSGTGGQNTSSNVTAGALYLAGTGGTVSVSAGSGGAGSVGASKGGGGGGINFNAGNGGASDGAAGGGGGSLSFSAGFGGTANSTANSGVGGSATFQGGTGGSNSTSGGQAGAGGTAIIVSGTGGTGFTGANGANSGNVTIDVGSPGTNGGGAGTAGSVGSVLIGQSASNSSSFLSIGLPTSTMTVYGTSKFNGLVSISSAVTASTSTTNIPVTALTINGKTSGTPGVGEGVEQDFYTKFDVGDLKAGYIQFIPQSLDTTGQSGTSFQIWAARNYFGGTPLYDQVMNLIATPSGDFGGFNLGYGVTQTPVDPLDVGVVGADANGIGHAVAADFRSAGGLFGYIFGSAYDFYITDAGNQKTLGYIGAVLSVPTFPTVTSDLIFHPIQANVDNERMRLKGSGELFLGTPGPVVSTGIFTVVGSTSDAFVAVLSTSTTKYIMAVSTSGNILTSGIGNFGIGTSSPTANLSFTGQSTQTIRMERELTAGTTGFQLLIQAGGAVSGGTNLNGGALTLASGISTGNSANSIVEFQIPSVGGSGTSDNAPATQMVLHPTATNPELIISNGTTPATYNTYPVNAYLSIYANSPSIGQTLFRLGSSNNSNQLLIKEQTAVAFNYGINSGNINVGATANQLDDVQNGNNKIIFGANSDDPGLLLASYNNMVFQTYPAVEAMRITTGASIFMGTSGPVISTGTLYVKAPTSLGYEAVFSTATNGFHLAISTSGHVVTGGPTPTISSCGSTPNGSAVGNDSGGAVTIGGGVVTSCVVTFAKPWGVSPDCNVTDNSTSVNPSVTSVSATAITIGLSATLGGGVVYYSCKCNQGASCI